MLIYHPAYDAYHCVFRLLLATEKLKNIEVVKLRILDFFLTFPAEIRHVRLPREHMEAKKKAGKLVNVYRGPINMAQIFREMEHIQLAALRALAASNILSQDGLEQGVVQRTNASMPTDILKRLQLRDTTELPVEEFILNHLSEIPLRGIDGLKHRTGLMEYRYDNV